jgi:hypothetical protein
MVCYVIKINVIGRIGRVPYCYEHSLSVSVVHPGHLCGPGSRPLRGIGLAVQRAEQGLDHRDQSFLHHLET